VINGHPNVAPETRQRALVKLDKFTAKVGYPAAWRDYSALVTDPADLYGNYLRGYAVNYDRELAAQGVGNSICGLLGALPMTGVIVRSSANRAGS